MASRNLLGVDALRVLSQSLATAALVLLAACDNGQIDLLPNGPGTDIDGSSEASTGDGSDAPLEDAASADAMDAVDLCANVQCAAPTPYCEPTQGTCVACLTDPNCTAAIDRKLCDPSAHRCVECIKDTDCTRELSLVCNVALGDCVH